MNRINCPKKRTLLYVIIALLVVLIVSVLFFCLKKERKVLHSDDTIIMLYDENQEKTRLDSDFVDNRYTESDGIVIQTEIEDNQISHPRIEEDFAVALSVSEMPQSVGIYERNGNRVATGDMVGLKVVIDNATYKLIFLENDNQFRYQLEGKEWFIK